MNDFRQINDVLGERCQIAFRQQLPDKKTSPDDWGKISSSKICSINRKRS